MQPRPPPFADLSKFAQRSKRRSNSIPLHPGLAKCQIKLGSVSKKRRPKLSLKEKPTRNASLEDIQRDPHSHKQQQRALINIPAAATNLKDQCQTLHPKLPEGQLSDDRNRLSNDEQSHFSMDSHRAKEQHPLEEHKNPLVGRGRLIPQADSLLTLKVRGPYRYRGHSQIPVILDPLLIARKQESKLLAKRRQNRVLRPVHDVNLAQFYAKCGRHEHPVDNEHREEKPAGVLREFSWHVQSSEPPDKKVIDRMLRSITLKQKNGEYNRMFGQPAKAAKVPKRMVAKKRKESVTKDTPEQIKEASHALKKHAHKKKERAERAKKKKDKIKKQNTTELEQLVKMESEKDQNSGGDKHEKALNTDSEPNSLLQVPKRQMNSAFKSHRLLNQSDAYLSSQGEDAEMQKKFIQENARAALQNERLKLKQSLIKHQAKYPSIQFNYKSSTNEGSRSFSNKLGKFQNFKINSGSSASSINSLPASNSQDADLTEPVPEDKASSRSLLASLSHSFSSSFYEFRNHQRTTKQQADVKQRNLAVLHSDRWSLMSMPLVEYDTLGQRKTKKKKGLTALNSPTSCQVGTQTHFGFDVSNSQMRQDSCFSSTSRGRGRTSMLNNRNTRRAHDSSGTPGSSQPLANNLWKYSTNLSFVEGFTEVVEEEKQEDDGLVYENLRRRQARFKLVQDKNEFNKKQKRNRSTEIMKEPHEFDLRQTTIQHDIDDVSENEEEEISDSSSQKHAHDQIKQSKKSKIYSIGYLTKKIWSKKIYSDDFDVDYEVQKINQKQRFKIGSVINSAIQEDAEQSEIENPYFSDNSASSQLTARLRKFSVELSKLVDKSDNESSALSVRSVSGATLKQTKLQNYHSNVNEPIYEEEDEKDDQADNRIISNRRRRVVGRHIGGRTPGYIKNKSAILMESDPIHEEIEIEDDELLSENNFYLSWQNHKRYLLTQDEQAKLFQEDCHSSTGIIEKSHSIPRKPGFSRLSGRRVARKRAIARNQSDKKLLDPIEEKKDDPEKSEHEETDMAQEAGQDKSKSKSKQSEEESPTQPKSISPKKKGPS